MEKMDGSERCEAQGNTVRRSLESPPGPVGSCLWSGGGRPCRDQKGRINWIEARERDTDETIGRVHMKRRARAHQCGFQRLEKRWWDSLMRRRTDESFWRWCAAIPDKHGRVLLAVLHGARRKVRSRVP